MSWDVNEEEIREALLKQNKDFSKDYKYLQDFVGQDVWEILSDEQKKRIGLNEAVRKRLQFIYIDKTMHPLLDQNFEANEVIKWYDNLESILSDWTVITGQEKGKARAYLEKWEVE